MLDRAVRATVVPHVRRGRSDAVIGIRELGRRGAKVMAVRLPGGPNGAKVGLDEGIRRTGEYFRRAAGAGGSGRSPA